MGELGIAARLVGFRLRGMRFPLEGNIKVKKFCQGLVQGLGPPLGGRLSEDFPARQAILVRTLSLCCPKWCEIDRSSNDANTWNAAERCARAAQD